AARGYSEETGTAPQKNRAPCRREAKTEGGKAGLAAEERRPTTDNRRSRANSCDIGLRNIAFEAALAIRGPGVCASCSNTASRPKSKKCKGLTQQEHGD